MLWIDKIQAQVLNIKVFEQETECSKRVNNSVIGKSSKTEYRT